MKMYITAWPIVSMTPSPYGDAYSTSPMQSFAHITIEVNSLSEASEEYSKHLETVKATGRPAFVFAGHDAGRRICGFEKYSHDTLVQYINTDKTPETLNA